MTNEQLANLLQKCLDKASTNDRWNLDMPPANKYGNYDGDKLATQIETLIAVLKEIE